MCWEAQSQFRRNARITLRSAEFLRNRVNNCRRSRDFLQNDGRPPIGRTYLPQKNIIVRFFSAGRVVPRTRSSTAELCNYERERSLGRQMSTATRFDFSLVSQDEERFDLARVPRSQDLFQLSKINRCFFFFFFRNRHVCLKRSSVLKTRLIGR